MRNGDSDKESHVILAQCLDDQDWMELVSGQLLLSALLTYCKSLTYCFLFFLQMFKKMDKIWCLCDQSE